METMAPVTKQIYLSESDLRYLSKNKVILLPGLQAAKIHSKDGQQIHDLSLFLNQKGITLIIE